ncbi:hypothetical protein ACQKNS_25700 [Peribacillus sp. NPDC094092]
MNQKNVDNAGSANQERQIASIVLWIAATSGGKTVKEHIVLTRMGMSIL